MSLSEKHALWLEDRQLPVEQAAEAGVVSEGDKIGFQYRLNGELRFTKWRTPDKNFWIAPSGQNLILWNLDSLKDVSSDTLIITEGELDCLAWMSAGAPAVVSVPNGASGREGTGEVIPSQDTGFSYLWTEDEMLIPELRHFTKFILATDGDKPGSILASELAIRLGRGRCHILTYPDDCKDTNDVLVKYGVGALAGLLEDAKPMAPTGLVRFSEIPMDNRRSYTVGWTGLDAHMRLRAPELFVLVGNAGSGKSQFALNIGANLARVHGLKGAILQFEDNPERSRKDLLTYAQTWSSQIADPAKWVDRMFRTIAPAEVTGKEVNYQLKWLHNTIVNAARVHSCKWVIVDPWNEIEHNWNGSNEAAYTNQALAQLKSVSRLLQIILIVVTHPGKAGAAKAENPSEMTLYDVAGSSAWKNKADHGVILIRPSDSSNDVIVKIDKVKDHERMGVPGIVKMRFNERHASYEYLGKG